MQGQPTDGERRSGGCCMGLLDTVCVCAGGGEMGFSTEDVVVVVVVVGWIGGDHCGRGEERQGGREAGEAADIHEDAKCFFGFFFSSSRRGDTLLLSAERQEGEGKREGEGDE